MREIHLPKVSLDESRRLQTPAATQVCLAVASVRSQYSNHVLADIGKDKHHRKTLFEKVVVREPQPVSETRTMFLSVPSTSCTWAGQILESKNKNQSHLTASLPVGLPKSGIGKTQGSAAQSDLDSAI